MFVQTDRGGEFMKDTILLFKELGIEHYFSNDPDIKVPTIERYNRTLKQRIAKYQDVTGNYRFIDALPKIVKGYNEGYHSSIKMTPTEASDPKNQEQVHTNLFGDGSAETEKRCKPKFDAGDFVVIPIKKGTFEKESTHKWTTERFVVEEVKHTTPCTYKLKDLDGEEIQGSFYEQEMQKVRKPDPEGGDDPEGIEEIEILARRTVRKQKQVRVKYKKSGKIAWIQEADIE
jgi:hypothetical protein